MSADEDIDIGGREVGRDHPPFVIAEMSGNHNQSLDRALAIVEAAARAGAHALKLQTYTADTMTLDMRRARISGSGRRAALWQGESLYELYQEALHALGVARADLRRAHASWACSPSARHSTRPRSTSSRGLSVPCYKIASFENTDLPLIRKVAATGKPMIISTGMATRRGTRRGGARRAGAGCRDLVLLKCTSTYPATPENTNIATIPHLRTLFGCEVGLSDHTMGIGVSVASVALGATVIEKHFTLRRADGGVDSASRWNPRSSRQLVTETRRAWQGLGRCQYGATDAEEKSLQFRRSLYVVMDLSGR